MKKEIIAKKENIVHIWDQNYSTLVPCFSIIFLAMINYIHQFNIIDICKNSSFDDMLTAIITSMSIVISIFGFLLPSLISAKEEKMVKYFLENADMRFFVKKIKGVIKSGIIGILLSIILYLYNDLLSQVLKVLLYIWIGVGLNFVCNSYRFISIIISLNTMSNDKVQELNSKLNKF